MNVKSGLFATLINIGLFPASAFADTNISGYLKSFAVAQDVVDTPVFKLPMTFQSQNSVRLMAEQFNERSVVQLHYELSPVLINQPVPFSRTFNVVGGSYRLSDLESSLSDTTDKQQIYQNLDRFNIQWNFDAGDLTVGRQAISFGSARIINPTDVFLPFDVRTFNTEYRTGVDGVRFQRPLGDLGELDIGVVLGEDADESTSAAFVQTRFNADGVDYQLAAIHFAEQDLLGGGIQTSLGSFGFWFEVAHVSGDNNYTRVSTGLDYALSENLFAMVEYHYNGAGSDDAAKYVTNATSLAYQRGGVFLLGKEYLMPSASLQLSPLTSVAAQVIYNLSDSSSFASLSAQRSLSDNLYTDLGLYAFTGDDPTVGAFGEPVLRSEYGGSPLTVYVSLRYYF